MTPKQLESRNKRRQRNRECAQRARVRKNNHVNELETKVKVLDGEKKFANTFHKNKLANISAKLHGMKWKMKAKVKSMERKMMENKSAAEIQGNAQAEKAIQATEGLLQRQGLRNLLIYYESYGMTHTYELIQELSESSVLRSVKRTIFWKTHPIFFRNL